MGWPRERGHVSLANFQVSDDIVGRSLGQIAGERESERETENLHHEDRSRRGERIPCCTDDTGRYPPPLLPERDFETRQARTVCFPPPMNKVSAKLRWIKIFPRDHRGEIYKGTACCAER